MIAALKAKFLNDDATRIKQLQALAMELGIRISPFQPNPTKAAVLIPIINHPDAPILLLTQRTLHLRRHAGQISFPGGICDEKDQTLQSCMLREVEEEIGLNRDKIQILGTLGEWPSFSGYAVTVYLGIVNPPVHLIPNKQEVEQVIEVPLSYALDPQNYETIHRDVPTPHHYFQFTYQDKLIWGFTGGVLRLLAALSKSI